MKKLVVGICLVLVYFFTFNYTFALDFSKIYKKIDVIYEKSPDKLIIINDKIITYTNRTKNIKKKEVFLKLNNYINFKFKNKDYYNQEVSKKIKTSVKIINRNSFTDQKRLDKLNKLLNNTELSLIDKDYIKYSILDSKVSILLNHQNFKDAKKITVDYFKLEKGYDNNKLNFVAKNVDYSSFGLLTQLIAWINPEKKGDIISYRGKYFKDELNTAWNVVRKKGYRGINCSELIIKDINIDLIDKKFCKILNLEFEENDIKEVDNLNNNLQNLSDRSNYYTYVGYMDGYKDKMDDKKKALGLKIIENDKNFINGYLILLNFYDYKNDCNNFNKYFKLLEKNYIGDEEQKVNIFNREYKNCSK